VLGDPAPLPLPPLLSPPPPLVPVSLLPHPRSAAEVAITKAQIEADRRLILSG
jgi:hypothetical protein